MSIGKTLRFEVFKRDNFQCQYCGKEAPNVVLEVDHIEPKSKGGTDDLLNLITSCFDCNRGKRDKRLTNKDEFKKQKEELKKLNKRKEQLELLLKWRNEVSNVLDDEVDALEEILSITGHSFSEVGRKNAKKAIKKYGLKEMLECAEISIDQYYKENDKESITKCFNYIFKIANNRQRHKDKPYLKDLYYIRGILRNRIHYVGDWESILMLEKAYNNGVDIDRLKEISLTVRNWTEFKEIMESLNGEE